MSKSYKLSGTGNYIDASGVSYNKEELTTFLDSIRTWKTKAFENQPGMHINWNDTLKLFTIWGSADGSFRGTQILGKVPTEIIPVEKRIVYNALYVNGGNSSSSTQALDIETNGNVLIGGGSGFTCTSIRGQCNINYANWN